MEREGKTGGGERKAKISAKEVEKLAKRKAKKKGLKPF